MARASVISATLVSPAIKASLRMLSRVLYRKWGLIWFWSARYWACRLLSLSSSDESIIFIICSSIRYTMGVGTTWHKSVRSVVVYPSRNRCMVRSNRRQGLSIHLLKTHMQISSSAAPITPGHKGAFPRNAWTRQAAV